MKIILLLISLISSFVYAESIKESNGYDKPKAIKVISAKKNKITCHVYPDFSILEVDEGDVGASKIFVNYRSEGMKTSDLCQKQFKGKQISLKNFDGYFDGLVNKYIFIFSGDTFGGIGGIGIFDASSGEQVFKTKYNSKQKFTIEHVDNKISITYFRPLKLSCVPSKENPLCWQQILEENGVDKNVKINLPDCSAAIKLAGDAYKEPDRSLQITVRVQIPDISDPKIVYLGGPSTCHATP